MEEKTTLVDLTTGEIRTKKKKVPKEKTPAENILKDAKTHYNKILDVISIYLLRDLLHFQFPFPYTMVDHGSAN